MPERASLCRFPTTTLSGLRRLPVRGFERHSIFYLVDKWSRRVNILAVLHNGRDVQTILQNLETAE